jgi:hypothetical protein
MTAAQFEESASYVYKKWWAIAEGLVAVPAVMDVEGWNLYGHPGNASLTEPQRVLMMWSDLVGQVSNGGFTQFIDNFRANLKLAYYLITKLGWDELNDRFDRAFREQAGDPANPKAAVPVGLDEEPEKWARSRERLLRHLARKQKKWRQPVTRRDLAFVEALHPEWRLQLFYQEAVARGELKSGGELLFDFVPPPDDEAEAFTSWLYSKDTKAKSREIVVAFALANRDALARIEG